MDTIKKLSDYAIIFGHAIRFIGCPKTIDNALQRIKGKMQRILEKEK